MQRENTIQREKGGLWTSLLLAGSLGMLFPACGNSDTGPGSTTPSGGSPSGGTTPTETGGSTASTGGKVETGGSTTTPATGGELAPGGSIQPSGGSTDDTSATGGSPTSGGSPSSGGSMATGGKMGGTTANGGSTVAGGTTASGGRWCRSAAIAAVKASSAISLLVTDHGHRRKNGRHHGYRRIPGCRREHGHQWKEPGDASLGQGHVPGLESGQLLRWFSPSD